MNAEVIPLGARLRQRREELGLTQAQVARELEVARRVTAEARPATPTCTQGQFCKRLPSSPSAPRVARTALLATAHGVPDPTLYHALLIASELVTNSVQRGRSPSIDLVITLDGDRLRIEVGDQDPRPIRRRTPDLHGGWGLALLAELADRLGSERTKRGKVVWAEFDVTDAG